VEPRRNPEIVVCALFEEGEHGSEAAHVAAKVIQAYAEKQRRQPTKMAKQAGHVEIGAVWTEPDADGGTEVAGWALLVDVAKRPLAAVNTPVPSTQYRERSMNRLNEIYKQGGDCSY